MSRGATLALALLLGWSLGACGDARPGPSDGGSISASDAASDAASDSGSPDGGAIDAASDAGGPDGGATDAASDAGARDAGTADAGADDAGGPDDLGPGGADGGAPVLVLAGDSWSTGLVLPLRAALDARGHADVALRWETTARAGSQARGWVANEHPPASGGGVDTGQPRLLDGLTAALDGPAPADVLVLVIGGNDFNREATSGLGRRGGALRDASFRAIESDVSGLVDFASPAGPGSTS